MLVRLSPLAKRSVVKGLTETEEVYQEVFPH